MSHHARSCRYCDAQFAADRGEYFCSSRCQDLYDRGKLSQKQREHERQVLFQSIFLNQPVKEQYIGFTHI